MRFVPILSKGVILISSFICIQVKSGCWEEMFINKIADFHIDLYVMQM